MRLKNTTDFYGQNELIRNPLNSGLIIRPEENKEGGGERRKGGDLVQSKGVGSYQSRSSIKYQIWTIGLHPRQFALIYFRVGVGT